MGKLEGMNSNTYNYDRWPISQVVETRCIHKTIPRPKRGWQTRKTEKLTGIGGEDRAQKYGRFDEKRWRSEQINGKKSGCQQNEFGFL